MKTPEQQIEVQISQAYRIIGSAFFHLGRLTECIDATIGIHSDRPANLVELVREND